MEKLVVFVCTGNTCRSPMAEGIFRKTAEDEGWSDVDVVSAGTHAADGRPVSPFAAQAAAEAGVRIERHRSRPLTAAIIRLADLLVVMEEDHRRAVLRADPAAAPKVVLLRDLLPPSDPRAGGDLPDPIGGPIEEYRRAFAEIAEALRAGRAELAARLEAADGADRT